MSIYIIVDNCINYDIYLGGKRQAQEEFRQYDKTLFRFTLKQRFYINMPHCRKTVRPPEYPEDGIHLFVSLSPAAH